MNGRFPELVAATYLCALGLASCSSGTDVAQVDSASTAEEVAPREAAADDGATVTANADAERSSDSAGKKQGDGNRPSHQTANSEPLPELPEKSGVSPRGTSAPETTDQASTKKVEKPLAEAAQQKSEVDAAAEDGPLLIAAGNEPSASGDSDAASPSGKKEKATLIPRKVLFGNPEKATARFSSDGRWLAFLAPVDGVLNVWVGPIDKPGEAKPVTKDKDRGIRRYFWAYTNRHILYTQDEDGNENDHVYAVDVETLETTDLTPLEKIQARINGVSEKFPEEILVGLNSRVPQLHDIYRVNIKTGERELIQENPGFAALMADDDYDIRLGITFTPDANQMILRPDDEGDWKPFIKIPPEDAMTSGPAGFDKAGGKLYFIDSRNRNTAALTVIDLESGEQEVLASDPKSDVGGVLAHPTEKNVQAVSFTYARRRWEILDDAIAGDIEFLNEVEDGEFQVTGRTLDDQHWSVAYVNDDGPVNFYHYDRAAQKARFLFSSRRDLDEYTLAPMHSLVIPTRDGLDMVSYLTLPAGSDADGDARPEEPLPMVLLVHGGPWARDSWGYNSNHQWLANRGYAVLSVNYRGSTGFGKEFINAANREWAGKMHDDLIDAVRWAVKEKIAVEGKIAIMGGSYGGYATLVGLTFTPEVFACGVDIVGPSSLVTLLKNVPPYWRPIMPLMKRRVGDHTTEAGREALLAASPLPRVDEIVRPLLIGQGANDPRVTKLEADQIVEAMQQRGIPVTYVLYPDEGHGFARPENRMSFNAVAEAFLAERLGGRYEPIGEDFQGASIDVRAGADQVPGLPMALETIEADEDVDADEDEKRKSSEP